MYTKDYFYLTNLMKGFSKFLNALIRIQLFQIKVFIREALNMPLNLIEFLSLIQALDLELISFYFLGLETYKNKEN